MQKQQKKQQNQQCKQQQLQQNNPILSSDLLLFQQMSIYQKNIQNENFKTRGGKRKQRLQKLRSDLKDPQQRKQRNRQRHDKQRQKLKKLFVGLSQLQIRQTLDKKKNQKEQIKKRVKKAVQDQIGQTFLIDNAFQHKMNEKQNKSLAAQIQLIVKTLKRIQQSPNVHICGVKGKLQQQLGIMKFQHWPLKSYNQDLKQIILMQKFKGRNIYYLSPDATQSVHNIQKKDIFIIGGLVDRTVIKNASLNRAQQLGIQARKLPIRQFMKQRTCLNLDHIVSIVCKFIQVQDWKVAFDHGAPKRWKKDAQKGPKKFKHNKCQKQQQENNQDSDSGQQYDQSQVKYNSKNQ